MQKFNGPVTADDFIITDGNESVKQSISDIRAGITYKKVHEGVDSYGVPFAADNTPGKYYRVLPSKTDPKWTDEIITINVSFVYTDESGALQSQSVTATGGCVCAVFGKYTTSGAITLLVNDFSGVNTKTIGATGILSDLFMMSQESRGFCVYEMRYGEV
jgi:hypothetical protein